MHRCCHRRAGAAPPPLAPRLLPAAAAPPGGDQGTSGTTQGTSRPPGCNVFRSGRQPFMSAAHACSSACRTSALKGAIAISCSGGGGAAGPAAPRSARGIAPASSAGATQSGAPPRSLRAEAEEAQAGGLGRHGRLWPAWHAACCTACCAPVSTPRTPPPSPVQVVWHDVDALVRRAAGDQAVLQALPHGKVGRLRKRDHEDCIKLRAGGSRRESLLAQEPAPACV